jgi:D-alanyl-D-alanine carboxypeptidase
MSMNGKGAPSPAYRRRTKKIAILCILPAALWWQACLRPSPARGAGDSAAPGAETSGRDAGKTAAGETAPEPDLASLLAEALERAKIPGEISQRIMEAAGGPGFILDLLSCLEGDPFLYKLVDKAHAIGDYAPEDLVELTAGGSYRVGRGGLMLRRSAGEALEEMAAAAAAEGIGLVVSSCYRSYAYQVEVYARNVREMGQAAADRESARPGHSQHQTGLAADFGSIDDSFAETGAGRWVLKNAGRFGWSLSFPQGYEDLTGYRWESWHYRYVGRELCAFIDNYFGGIQQYALQFIEAWNRVTGM